MFILLSSVPLSERRKWRRSKEKQHHYAVKIRNNRVESKSTNLVTTRISVSRTLPHRYPDKRSDTAIARNVNEIYQIIIRVKTASTMVRYGRMGMPPKDLGTSRYVSS